MMFFTPDAVMAWFLGWGIGMVTGVLIMALRER